MPTGPRLTKRTDSQLYRQHAYPRDRKGAPWHKKKRDPVMPGLTTERGVALSCELYYLTGYYHCD